MALQQAPNLGLPGPAQPFIQTIDKRDGYKTSVSVLLQEHGGQQRPVAYFSTRFDPVATGLPMCLRTMAAAEKAVHSSWDFVRYTDLTLKVPHAVSPSLLDLKTFHLSAAPWLHYNTCLLQMPVSTVKRCNVLNPATLLPSSHRS